jgi:hypothetical protein
MINKKNLTLYEESYNEGYEQGINDFIQFLKSNRMITDKKKIELEKGFEDLLKSFKKED